MTSIRRFLPLLLPLAAGCSSVLDPRVDMDPPPVVNIPAMAQPVATNGAIFQSASYRPLFEQHRARMVGDTLTISIAEKVTASQSSTSKADRSGALSADITAVPLIKPNSFANGRASAGASSSNVTEGKGSNENSNEFSGTVTAVVVGVLPNGHLLISAEKQIGVNNNVDVLRFSGQVDPRAIQAGNSVASTAVANVRIEQRGRGAAAEGLHGIGWLSRFFLSLSPT